MSPSVRAATPVPLLRRLRPLHLAALAAWFAIVALVTGAWRNVPVIDDWTYAWTVEQFLHTGRFAVLDWSSAYPVVQTLWGAAWAELLGFSFGVLRFSTLLLGLGACAALYLLLRELGATARVALVGALALAVNPVFVLLSSSFMTDVPFTAFVTAALLCYVRAGRRGDPRLLWWGGLWAYGALLSRLVGIIVPVAAVPLLFLQPVRPAMTRRQVIAPLAVTWAAMLATWLALREALGTTSIMQRWAWNLYARPDYLHMNLPLFLVIAFYLIPALLAAGALYGLWRRPWRLAAAAIAVSVALGLALGGIPLPLASDSTWSLHELGASRLLINGPPLPDGPWWASVAARLAAVAAATLLVLAATARRGPAAAARAAIASALARAGGRGEPLSPARRAWVAARAPLLAYLAVYAVLINLLWMYHDRYSLPVMPVCIALVLGTRPPGRATLRAATAALVLFGGVALLGTRDALRYNEEVRDTWESLVDAGVPPSDIDAGYAWNGWALYAHPDNLRPGLTPLRDVPWITSGRKTPYVIAKAPVAGYRVERAVRWHDLPWPGEDQLLVLRKQTTNKAVHSSQWTVRDEDSAQ